MAQDVARFDEQWAKDAQQYANEEQGGGGQFISCKGGIFQLGEEEFPGNELIVVVLDAIRENVYYDSRYDPDVAASPKCYAFGRSDEEMAPHRSMMAHPYFEPQHEQCVGCPRNEWGTSNTGKGKACGNRRRLAVVHAGFLSKRKGSRDFDVELFNDPQHFAEADIHMLKLPVMSVKEWGKYVGALSANLHKPPYAVVTRIYSVPDAKSQFRIKFELVEPLADTLAPVIMERHAQAKAGIITAYSPPKEDDGQQDSGGALKGLKKKG